MDLVARKCKQQKYRLASVFALSTQHICYALTGNYNKFTSAEPVLSGHSKGDKIGFQDQLSRNAGQK